MQAKLFGDELEAVLARYRNRQITGAEVVKALVDLAKKVRDARHRHQGWALAKRRQRSTTPSSTGPATRTGKR